ncbi:MAG: hypothetical protein MJY84_06510 [Bacteroidales bacterium]|nr:hypothetical protein [Bacteroidales bacterium]
MKKTVLSVLAVAVLLALNVVAFTSAAVEKRSGDSLTTTDEPIACGQAMSRCQNGKIGLLCTMNTGGWTCKHRDCGGC